MNPFASLLFVLPLLAAGVAEVVAADSEAVTSGRVLLGELNCTACHAANAEQIGITPKQGPRLADIGSRVGADWLRRYLAAPHNTMPGTTMPDLLHGLPDSERAVAADDLTHALLAQQSLPFQRTVPDRAAVARGESLYRRVGCVACHAPAEAPALSGSPLPQMAEKWSLDGLRHFLLDPLATRPSGRMPAMGLSEREASDLAQYLLRETRIPAPLDVAVRRGRMSAFDDLAGAELIRSVVTNGFTGEVVGRDRNAACHFSGWLQVEQAGDYTFYLTATGGTRLSLRGQWLTGNDTWDTEQVALQTTAHLDAGWHALAVDFIPRGQRDPALTVEWQGPGVAREIIPAAKLRSEREPPAAPPRFVVDAAKVERGRARYDQLGCASCHDAQKPGLAVPPSAVPKAIAPALATAASERGCLADQLSADVPDYHLAPTQRTALRAALETMRSAGNGGLPPAQHLAHTLTTFRCYACHVRDGHGGVATERSAFFTSNTDDAGDEGRLPPTLDGVGDRLRPTWLATVLTQGSRIRPYLDTRMPQFGAANVGHLAALFIALDRQGQAPEPGPEAIDDLREAGRKQVGTEGLSCIACHRFNRQPAHALQMLDLATVPERLNEDWFRRFLRDPNRFHPGTRMPMLWPGGQSLLPTVLQGDTDRQHAALWAYLSDGPRAKFPAGLSRTSMELIVGGEAVVYRGKLWEAGFRAIATGYPGGVNVAFDAEDMRWSLLWHGRFLDASPHWSVAGMGQIRPLGTDLVVLPHGPALAQLTDVTSPWPSAASKALGMAFRGYQLDAQKRPTLLYTFRDAAVEDRADPLAGSPTDTAKPGLHRTLTVTGTTVDGLHLRVAVGDLVATGPQSWRLNQALTLRVGASGAAFVRGVGNQQELLVPIVFRDGKGHVEIDYAW
jgi:mono/diheme cytochrome c family protein